MTKHEFSRAVRPPFKARYGNYIGGAWVEPVVRQASSRTPRRSTARSSARSPARTPPTSRRRSTPPTPPRTPGAAPAPPSAPCILNAIAQRMEDNLDLLAPAETWDNGKPIRETTAADLPLAIDHFRYFAGCIRAQEGGISEIDARHRRLPLPRAAGRRRPDHPVELPDPDGGAGSSPRRWPPATAWCSSRPSRPRPRSWCWAELIGDLLPPGVLNIVNGFGLEAGKPLASSPAHRQDRLHRRDHHRPADHAVRQPEPDPGDPGAGRQVAEHLLRGRDAPRTTTSSTRRIEGFVDVRPQPGRGLHLPEPRPDPRVDLRPLHGAGAEAGRGDRPGRPARPGDHDRRPGLQRAAREDPQLLRHRPAGRRARC